MKEESLEKHEGVPTSGKAPVAIGALVAGFLAGTWVSRRRG